MELREEIARIIETENAYGYYARHRALELADSILSLPSLREALEKATGTCVWTWNKSDMSYTSSCGTQYLAFRMGDYCCGCGKKVEVKDA